MRAWFDLFRFRFLFRSPLRPVMSLAARDRGARAYFVHALSFLKDAADSHGGLRNSLVLRSGATTTLRLHHVDGEITDFTIGGKSP